MLPVLLTDTEFMYHQRCMISALDSIIKLFFTSSSSSSSLLINHINDCAFQKIVLPVVIFLILHFNSHSFSNPFSTLLSTWSFCVSCM